VRGGCAGLLRTGWGRERRGGGGKGVCRVAEVGLRSLTCEGRGGMGGWGVGGFVGGEQKERKVL